MLSTERLLEIDRDIMSWGDTVHYQKNTPIFVGCQGDIATDRDGNSYVDSQMWHSSCNFGYNNPIIQQAVAKQLQVLPQVSGDFLHEEKLELAALAEEEIFKRTGHRGRISFNCSGTLVVEDAIKLMRKHSNKAKLGAFTG